MVEIRENQLDNTINEHQLLFQHEENYQDSIRAYITSRQLPKIPCAYNAYKELLSQCNDPSLAASFCVEAESVIEQVGRDLCIGNRLLDEGLFWERVQDEWQTRVVNGGYPYEDAPYQFDRLNEIFNLWISSAKQEPNNKTETSWNRVTSLPGTLKGQALLGMMQLGDKMERWSDTMSQEPNSTRKDRVVAGVKSSVKPIARLMKHLPLWERMNSDLAEDVSTFGQVGSEASVSKLETFYNTTLPSEDIQAKIQLPRKLAKSAAAYTTGYIAGENMGWTIYQMCMISPDFRNLIENNQNNDWQYVALASAAAAKAISDYRMLKDYGYTSGIVATAIQNLTKKTGIASVTEGVLDMGLSYIPAYWPFIFADGEVSEASYTASLIMVQLAFLSVNHMARKGEQTLSVNDQNT